MSVQQAMTSASGSGSNSMALSSLADPTSLAKLQVLLVPIQQDGAPLSKKVYDHWSGLIKRHASIRGDELRPTNHAGSSHQNGPNTANGSFTSGHSRGNAGKSRFLPPVNASMSKGAGTAQIHLTYPSHPPARHLANLSLLRLSLFPLVVIGITLDPDSAEAARESAEPEVKGYEIDGEANGEASTPTAPTTSTTPPKSPAGSDSKALQCFDEALGSLFPPDSPFPLVRRLIMVSSEAGSRRGSAKEDIPPEVPPKVNASALAQLEGSSKGRREDHEVLHAPLDGHDTWTRRLLGEIVGDVLIELGDLMTALETPQGLKTLSNTLLPSLTSNQPTPTIDTHFTSPSPANGSDGPTRPNTTTPIPFHHSATMNNLSAASAGVGISLKRSLTPGGRPTSVGPPSLPPLQTNAIASGSQAPTPTATTSTSSNPFKRSSVVPSPFNRSSSAAALSTTSTMTSAPHLNNSKYTTASLSGLAGGRLLKLLGDGFLIAGMYGDAIKCFDDGAEKCRAVGDVLWEALAREGRAVAGIGESWEGRDGSTTSQPFPNSPIPVEILTHFLSSLACLSRAPLPYPPTILSPSPQAASGSISFAPSSGSNPSIIGTGEGLIAYLHSGLSLRISHFLLIIWASQGWGSIALSSLFTHTFPRSFPLPPPPDLLKDPAVRRKRRKDLSVLTVKSQLDRHNIFSHAESALGPQHRALTKAEQVSLCAEVVWLAKWLDLGRKEAYVTREMVKKIASMIVEAREENRRIGNAGFSSSQKEARGSAQNVSKILDSASLEHGNGQKGVRRTTRESSDGNDGIKELLERAINIMSIDLLPLSSIDTSDPAKVSISGNNDDAQEIQVPKFGWPELQVETIKESISVAESLLDQSGVIRLCISALRTLHTYLNPQSQVLLVKMLAHSVGVARRRGISLGKLPWWIPGTTVLSIEVASLPQNRLPTEHARDEIVPTKGKDPFLYNPRLKAAQAGQTVLVAGEPTDIFVTLRNPFAFDLEIQDLSLITSGVEFTVNPLSVTIAPSSVQTVRVAGLASTSGTLQIKGVSLRLPDGSSRDTLLPVVDENQRKNDQKRQSRLATETGKTKVSGLDARWPVPVEGNRDSVQLKDSAEKWLECKVVEEQPLVWIKRTSLTHGTVMLYDGETSTIRITLENTSSVPVDFIKLSFDDSLSRSAKNAILEGELSPQQAYELEWDMQQRPVLSWDSDTEIYIPPNGRTTLNVKCLGKVGCTDGSIRIDYGYVKRPNTDGIPKSLQTRQVTFPVTFTVYHTLESHSLDILRLTSSTKIGPGTPEHGSSGQTVGLYPPPNGKLSPLPPGVNTPRTPATPRICELEDESFKNTFKAEMDGNHCLFGLSISNVYGVPFEVSLARKIADSQNDLATTRLIPSGATERLVIPIPRLSLPSLTTSHPIPSLSERQYVVEKSKKTPFQIQAERELFWYREELLKTVSATWSEPGSKRSGTLSLRSQYLTPSLLDILRIDDIEINLHVPTQETGIKPTDFITMEVTLTNRSERSFQPFLRVEALPTTSTDTSWATPPNLTRRPVSGAGGHGNGIKNVIFDGFSSQTLPLIPAGEKLVHKLKMMFLATGTFGFRAAVEEVIVPDGGSGEKGVEGDVPKVRFSPLLHVKVEDQK